MPLSEFESKKIKELVTMLDGDSEKISKVLDLVTMGKTSKERETVEVSDE